MAKNRKGNSASFAGKKLPEDSGFVSLVGAGPGDEGLMTLKGFDRLSTADSIVYDSLVNPFLLLCNDRAVKIDAGKRHKKENKGPYWTQKKLIRL